MSYFPLNNSEGTSVYIKNFILEDPSQDFKALIFTEDGRYKRNQFYFDGLIYCGIKNRKLFKLTSGNVKILMTGKYYD